MLSKQLSPLNLALERRREFEEWLQRHAVNTAKMRANSRALYTRILTVITAVGFLIEVSIGVVTQCCTLTARKVTVFTLEGSQSHVY